jgi:hypothetical protein
MKSLYGVLHGKLWIRVHNLPEFVGDHYFFNIFFQHDKLQGKFHNIFVTHKYQQVIILN